MKSITLANYSEDQARDEGGRFSDEGSAAASAEANKKSDAIFMTGDKAGHQAAAEAHATAAKVHRAAAGSQTNSEQAAWHGQMAATHEARSHWHQQEAANSPDHVNGRSMHVVLTNDSPIAADGWALIAPFGEHPKTRVYREDGQIKEQQFIQVLDNESADALLAKENSFFRKLHRALVGIPTFKGHGDLNDADPAAVSNEAQKIKIGVVDQVRKGERGIEAHFALDNEGAEAVEAGFKYPSAFWWVLPIANGQSQMADGKAIRCRPFKLISVALTPYPNISGVESLANARPAGVTQQENEKENDMKLIAGWLLANGVALANAESPTETMILEGFQKLHSTKVNEATALGNDKTTLGGRITALENERNTEKSRADQATTALANEQSARKAERKGRAEATTDLAIHRGILTIAEREGQVTALENSADFDKDAAALLAKQPATKTTSNNTSVSGKQSAALSNEEQETRSQYDTAFKAELIANGQDPVRAHAAVMKKPEYKGLAQKLMPRNKS
jgi:hypothetical protein